MDEVEYLEKLIQEANRNPMLREYIQKIGFCYPYNKLQYVKGSAQQRVYIRRRPFTYELPSAAQAEARLRFSQAAISTYEMRGTIETEDGRRIPANARMIGDSVRCPIVKDKESRRVRHLRKILEQIKIRPTFLEVERVKL